MVNTTGAPGRAAPQIRYALSRMRSRNGHHEFEHLCRELARMRIAPNILPATGPVSAGGDQGRDFETFRTLINERLPGGFLACEGDRPIVFSCTLQRGNLAAKITKDLQAITDGGPVDRMYFFCEQDIPVARRHDLCTRVRENHGIELVIIDGQALSELLAAGDCLWIAERYLGLEVSAGGPQTTPPSERSPGLLSGNAGTGLLAGVIHGDVHIHHAETPAGIGPATGNRRRRRGSPPKGWRIAVACVMAVATAAVLGLVLAQRSASVLHEVAARAWSGPVSYDPTLMKDRKLHVKVTLSFDPSPSGKPGQRIGWIIYGTGCPRESLTLARENQKILVLASSHPTRAPSCTGNSALASYLSNKISITIMLAGSTHAVMSIAATSAGGNLYKGTLRVLN